MYVFTNICMRKYDIARILCSNYVIKVITKVEIRD